MYGFEYTLMRKSADWMTLWDDRVLEYLDTNESASPSVLEELDYIHISRSQISRRLRKLRDHGLVRHLGNGVYVITTDGKSYLDGELNAMELDDESGNGEDEARA